MVTGTFAAPSGDHVAGVANGVEETTVTATAGDDGATHKVAPGGLLDEDGTTTRIHTVSVTRAEPLTACLGGAPESHIGTDAFTFRVAFSGAVAIGFASFQNHALAVTEGSETGARRVDRRSDLWGITV